jgi:hypothetical protein
MPKSIKTKTNSVIFPTQNNPGTHFLAILYTISVDNKHCITLMASKLSLRTV